MASDNLTPRQRRFVAEYGICLNAAEAARKAGYSEKTARTQGSRLLTNVDMQRAIRQQQAEVAEELRIKKEDQLRFLKSVQDRAPLDEASVGDSLAAAKEINRIMGYGFEKSPPAPEDQRVTVIIGIAPPQYAVNQVDAGTGKPVGQIEVKKLPKAKDTLEK